MREKTATGRAQYRQQIYPIWAEQSITYKGEERRLKDLTTLDNMAVHFASKGLTGQQNMEVTGLMDILDQAMKNTMVKTIQAVREKQEEIMALAVSLSTSH